MAAANQDPGMAALVNTPPTSSEMPDFRELWEYRGLLLFLVRRDVKLRLQQTLIGYPWIVLQPLMEMLIFYVVFSILIKVPANGMPCHLFHL